MCESQLDKRLKLAGNYISMALNFDNICRLCMVQNELLLPLFDQDATNLPARIMTLAPNVKVGWFGNQAFECKQCLAEIVGIGHYYGWLEGVVLVHAHNVK